MIAIEPNIAIHTNNNNNSNNNDSSSTTTNNNRMTSTGSSDAYAPPRAPSSRPSGRKQTDTRIVET